MSLTLKSVLPTCDDFSNPLDKSVDLDLQGKLTQDGSTQDELTQDEIADLSMSDEELNKLALELDGEITDDQAAVCERRIARMVFASGLSVEDIGIDPDSDYDEAKAKKLLKAHVKSKTDNKIAQWDFDGYFLSFREVVEVEFDYFPYYALWDHTELFGIKPKFDPDADCLHIGLKRK